MTNFYIPPLTKSCIIGGPAEIRQLENAMPQAAPNQYHFGTFHGVKLVTSTLVDPGYAYMLQNGKVVAVLDLGGGKMFMDKWKRDGEALKALIERLEQY